MSNKRATGQDPGERGVGISKIYGRYAMVLGLQNAACGVTQFSKANRGGLGTEDRIDVLEKSDPNDPVEDTFISANI